MPTDTALHATETVRTNGHVPVSTYIVDDQPDIRALLRAIIEDANEGLSVAGEAATGAEAVESLADADPTVVVLDEMMPGMTGLETAEAIRSRRPGQRILLCTAFLNPELIRRAKELGIDAWLSKDQLRDLVPTLHALGA